MKVVVANDELRTWNPPVDKESSTVVEVQKGPVNAYGTSGVRLTVNVPNMLEGFRKGRIVRVFGGGWKLKDQPYGESLMGYGYAGLHDADLLENLPKEYPAQFPFRTDWGNAHLPWYSLKEGEAPPRFSEHQVLGALASVAADGRGGTFQAEGATDATPFTVTQSGSSVQVNLNTRDNGGPARFQSIPATVRYLNADASLFDIPLGTRCRFDLYQDTGGRFTRASLVTDEFSHMAANALSYRIDAIRLDEGKLNVAWQIPEVKNYNGDMEQPPDIGRSELRVTADTRVWKADKPVKLADLVVGDTVLVNLTAELPGRRPAARRSGQVSRLRSWRPTRSRKRSARRPVRYRTGTRDPRRVGRRRSGTRCLPYPIGSSHHTTQRNREALSSFPASQLKGVPAAAIRRFTSSSCGRAPRRRSCRRS